MKGVIINNLLKRSLLIGGVVTTVGLGSLAGSGMASADADNHGSDNLAQKIAEKFNISKDDVQKVVDENREAHQAERQKKTGERLQKLVDDGTITAEQKTAIEAKMKELKAEHEANKGSMKDLSEDERKAKMEEKRSELEAWAKEQGLDLNKLKGVFGGPGSGHGHRSGPRAEQ